MTSISFFMILNGVPSALHPKNWFLAADESASTPTKQFVTNTAVKILTRILIISVIANPLTAVEPN